MGYRATHLQQYIAETGQGMPGIRPWKWGGRA